MEQDKLNMSTYDIDVERMQLIKCSKCLINKPVYRFYQYNCMQNHSICNSCAKSQKNQSMLGKRKKPF